MVEFKQTETFRKWRRRIKDERTRVIIASRLDRLGFGHAGDAKPVGHGISELRIDFGPGYRIYFRRSGMTIIILLCGGDKSTQAKDVETASACRKNGATMKKKAEKLTNYDPAEDLGSDEAITVFMAEALQTNDAAYIAHAVGVVARAKGMAQIAEQTGLSREQLYRSFSQRGNPTLKTTLAVMSALGVTLTAKILR